MPDLDQDNYVATIEYGRDPQFVRTRCGGCEWIGFASELTAIEACSLTPGDASPAGRCPECGTLAYLERQHPAPPFKTPVYLAAGKFLCAADAELIAQLVDHTPDEAAAIVRLVNAAVEYDDEVEVRDPDPHAEATWDAQCAGEGWTEAEQLRRMSLFLRESGLFELLLEHAQIASDTGNGVAFDIPAGERRIGDAFALLAEAASYEREKFEGDPDTDLNVSGADMVDWFSGFRNRADTLVNAERESAEQEAKAGVLHGR